MTNPLIDWSPRFEQELVLQIALGPVLDTFPRLIDAELFDSPEHQTIVQTILDYHKKHGTVPGSLTQDILERARKKKKDIPDVLDAWKRITHLEDLTPWEEMRTHLGARCLYKASKQEALKSAEWIEHGTYTSIEEWCEAQKDLTERVERIKYAANAKKPFKVTHAAEFIAPPVEWLIEGLIPKGMLSMVAGKDGLGKSLLAMEACRCVLTGESFLGKFPVKITGPILYLALDDPDSLINDRLKDLGMKDHPDCYVPQDIDASDPITLIRHTQIEASRIPFALIVVDCLYRLFPQKEGSSNDASAMGPLVTILNTLAEKTQAAVIVIHHENKKGGGDIAGSFAIRASLKVLLKISKPGKPAEVVDEGDPVDETERLIRLDKSKLTHEKEWHVRLTCPTWNLMSADEVRASKAKRVVRENPHTGKAIGIQFYEHHLGKGQQITCAEINKMAAKNVPPLTKHQLEDARRVLGVATIRPGNVPTACIPARVRENELREGISFSMKNAKESLGAFYRGGRDGGAAGAEGAEGEQGEE